MTARLEPYGEGALLIVLGDDVSLATARRARDLTAVLTSLATTADGWGVPVQGITSVLLPIDPLVVSMDAVAAQVGPLAAALPDEPGPTIDGRTIEIRVRYGGDDGRDLEAVAELTGLTTAAVIERHAARIVEVLMLGFAPGFPYLGLNDEMLAVPRRATPRPHVAAGSVGLAGRMTGIYPSDLPGGWRIIGRTDVRLFDPLADPPALLRPGDRIRFVPMTDP